MMDSMICFFLFGVSQDSSLLKCSLVLLLFLAFSLERRHKGSRSVVRKSFKCRSRQYHNFPLLSLLIVNSGRNDHIAEHYEKQSLSAYQWCPSQVVKALLKQAYPDFNALNAWKARLPNGDKDIQWSEADANRLRRKLEFHEDLPDRIATEAHSMALKFRANFQTLPWTPADSRVTTLTAPIEYVNMNKGPWQLDSKEIVPQIKPEPAPMVFELSGASKTNFF
jgi:hypothetical protein